MRTRPVLFLTAVAATALLHGCGADSPRGHARPDAVTVYSIDGGREPQERAKTAEEFHDYPVLGKVEVADTAAALELTSAVEEAIDNHGGDKCFDPRHGIRIVRAGRQIDYVICFQCENVYIYDSGAGGQGRIRNVKKIARGRPR